MKNETRKPDRRESKHYCIFEDKICPYASNENGCFECKAPSDEDMSCNE